MRRSFAACLLAPAALLAAASATAADAWRSIPYETLHRALTSVTPLEDAQYIQLEQRIAVTAPGMTLDDLRMVIDADGGEIEVPVDSAGTMDFPLSEALLDENPPVRVNVPDGGLSLNLSLDTTVSPAERFSYGLVADMAEEFDRFSAEQGLVARMMAPDVAGLRVEFAEGPRGTARVGDEVLAAGPDGVLLVPLRGDWVRQRPEVVLSRMPALMRLAFEE
ncbi:MAG: DUF2987 domain-containing protein [Gammaproteobacteria bacterium]